MHTWFCRNIGDYWELLGRTSVIKDITNIVKDFVVSLHGLFVIQILMEKSSPALSTSVSRTKNLLKIFGNFSATSAQIE